MNLVKWVDPRAMMNTFVEGRLLPSGNDAVPVIPLSALREVVEGLPDEFRQYERTLLEAHAGLTEEQLCGATIALHWVNKRLLASLGEVEK